MNSEIIISFSGQFNVKRVSSAIPRVILISSQCLTFIINMLLLLMDELMAFKTLKQVIESKPLSILIWVIITSLLAIMIGYSVAIIRWKFFGSNGKINWILVPILTAETFGPSLMYLLIYWSESVSFVLVITIELFAINLISLISAFVISKFAYLSPYY